MKILSTTALPHGRFEGASDGPASISMILDESEPGGGPRLNPTLVGACLEEGGRR
jgi:hypothetical protein